MNLSAFPLVLGGVGPGADVPQPQGAAGLGKRS